MNKDPITINFGYRLIRRMMRGLLKALLRVEVTGLDKVATKKPVVIMSNHKNWIDPLLIMAFLPPMRFTILAEEVSKIQAGWVQRLIDLAQLDFIAIDRGNQKSRLRGFLKAVKHMKKGGSVLIFPEGRLNQKDDDTHPYFLGAFSLAVKTESDILPIYMRGNEEIYLGRKVTIAIGAPIGTSKELDVEAFARKVHRIHTQEIKPEKPVGQPKKKRIDLTGLFINGVIEGSDGEDIIIKGRQATAMFNQFNEKHRDEY